MTSRDEDILGLLRLVVDTAGYSYGRGRVEERAAQARVAGVKNLLAAVEEQVDQGNRHRHTPVWEGYCRRENVRTDQRGRCGKDAMKDGIAHPCEDAPGHAGPHWYVIV